MVLSIPGYYIWRNTSNFWQIGEVMNKKYSVGVRLQILSLIRYKVEGNDSEFEKTALAIARDMESEGSDDAAGFIKAQFGKVRTFKPM